MKENSKRKGTLKHLILPVITILIVIVILGFAGWWVYKKFSGFTERADIIFLRTNENNVINIYSIDIDIPNAQARQLTHYENAVTAGQITFSDDRSWLIYIEQVQDSRDNRIIRLDLRNGQRTVLVDCYDEIVDYCRQPELNGNGSYLSFVGSEIGETDVVVWVLNLAEEDREPQPIGSDNIHLFRGFISDTEIEYVYYEPPETIIYNIETQETHLVEPSLPVDNRPYSVDSYDDGNCRQHIIRNNETSEEVIYFPYSEYFVSGARWNDDYTQLVFLAQTDLFAHEGEIWVYDLLFGEVMPLNEVGRNIYWLN